MPSVVRRAAAVESRLGGGRTRHYLATRKINVTRQGERPPSFLRERVSDKNGKARSRSVSQLTTFRVSSLRKKIAFSSSKVEREREAIKVNPFPYNDDDSDGRTGGGDGGGGNSYKQEAVDPPPPHLHHHQPTQTTALAKK